MSYFFDTKPAQPQPSESVYIGMHSLGIEAMKSLVSRFGPEGPPKGYYEYVHYAADLQTLEYLKSVGAKMKLSFHEYGNKVSPMEWAVKREDPSLVKFVKENCSTPYDIYVGLDRLLRCKPVNMEIFELLKDAEVNDHSENGTFYLLYYNLRNLAVQTTRCKKNPETILEFENMRYIASVLNPRRRLHNTFINEASGEGDIVGVKRFWPYENKASREKVVKIAAENGMIDIVDFGLKNGADFDPYILSVSALTNPKLFAHLIQLRLPLDSKYPKFIDRGLEYAISCDREDSLKAAFDAGIDPNRKIGNASLIDFAKVYESNDCYAYMESLGVKEISKDFVYKQFVENSKSSKKE